MSGISQTEREITGGSNMEEEEAMVDLEVQPKHVAPSIFIRQNHPVSLKFEEVMYRVKIVKDAGLFTKGIKTEEKVILNGITGIVLPGEMLVMLGPSGSGKTTLLSALGGKLGGELDGSITYNGKPFSSRMKRNTGFVTQDDVLYPHLTVTETLFFTALLRLPNCYTKQEKIMHAEAVITQLGLSNCRDSKIGGPLERGVSGGERKRVSIGQEMLINPSVIFLDEPTSGLDSTTAQRIVSSLWELSKGGRTIVMTIHQPSSRLFYMFDKVLVLSEGNPLYFGLGSQVMEYFSSIGYAPLVPMNPSDFLLDLANGVPSDGDSQHEPSVIKLNLISAYKSNRANKLRAEVQEIVSRPQDRLSDKQIARWATTWLQQFLVLLTRGVKERKYESFSGLHVGEVFVVAILSGLLWWKTDESHLQDRIGLLFFYSGFWGFYPLFQAIFTFPEERKMLEKERSSGMYRLSSYFMSRIVSDLPMELVLPTIFVTITYWMAGLKHAVANFLHTLFVILLSVLCSQGLGLALGALVMDLKAATMLGSVIMLTFMLAGGFYVQHVPSMIRWIKFLSIIQNTYKLLLGSQYKPGDTYPCNDGTGGECLVGEYPAVKLVGLDGQVVSTIALVIMLVGYRLVAYIALMRVGVTRKKENVLLCLN